MFLKKITSFLFLLGFCSVLNGQPKNNNIDLALKNHYKMDTIRCINLIDFVEENRLNTDVQDVNLELKNTVLKI